MYDFDENDWKQQQKTDLKQEANQKQPDRLGSDVARINQFDCVTWPKRLS